MLKKKVQISLIASMMISCAITLNAQNNEKIVKLKTVDIIEKNRVTEIIKHELIKIPGGTNIVDLNKIQTSTATLNKVLSTEPGVIIQEFFGGNDQPRINVRGSGIQSNPVNNGLNLLYDGSSINQADGSFVIGLIDPQQNSAVSVFRGANAMRYGSASLGGAINFIPKTRLNSDSFVNLEVGSHNTRNFNLGIGGSNDALDYYLSAGFAKSDGFRAQSDSERKNLAINIGYAINDNVENRTQFNYTDNFFNIPFVIQKQIAASNPSAILGDGYASNFPSPFTSGTATDTIFNNRGGWDGVFDIYKRKPHRDTKQFRISNKTTFKVNDDIQHQIAIYGEKLDDTFTDPLSHEVSDSNNIGINLYTEGMNSFFDEDTYALSLAYNKGSMPVEYWVNSAVDGSKVFKYADLDREADNLAVNLQYNFSPSKNTEIVTDLQWIRNTRNISGTASTPVSQGGFADTSVVNINKDFSYSALNPKLGLIIKTSKQSNIYANISRSMEAPTFNQLVYRSVVPLVMPNSTNPPFTNAVLASGANIIDLEEQTATTYEIGTKGIWQDSSWQASYYYSKLKDELITQVDVSAVNGSTFNYPDSTIHQGLELGINHILTQNIFTDNDKISTNLVYNYNDFKFDGGIYKGNQIAGIPKQTIYIEVSYSLGNYLVIAPNIRIQPDDNYADHSNSLKQDSFNLLGLKLSYQPTPKLTIYADLNNLTDENYEATYVIRGKSGLASPTFLPGDGFNTSLGIKYTW